MGIADFVAIGRTIMVTRFRHTSPNTFSPWRRQRSCQGQLNHKSHPRDLVSFEHTCRCSSNGECASALSQLTFLRNFDHKAPQHCLREPASLTSAAKVSVDTAPRRFPLEPTEEASSSVPYELPRRSRWSASAICWCSEGAEQCRRGDFRRASR